MTKANYCCHFIKGIRLGGGTEALTGIDPMKRAGWFFYAEMHERVEGGCRQRNGRLTRTRNYEDTESSDTVCIYTRQFD